MPPVPGDTRPRGSIDDVEERGGHDAARRPADHRAQADPPAGEAAADGLDERLQGDAALAPRRRRDARSGPERPKTLVPGDFGVPSPANHAAPRPTMDGMAESVSTLLMTVGLPQSPDSTGNGRTGAGLRAPPLDRFEERGLLAEDEAARAAPQLDAAGEVASEHAGADEAGLFRLRDRATRAAPQRDRPRRARRG